jgi:putative adenylate-forming enzyme
MYFKLKIIWYLIELKLYKWFYSNNLARLQNKRWKSFQIVLLKSPFYSTLAKENKSLEAYPIMNKSSFMENFNAINTQKIKLEEAFHVAFESEKSRNFSPMIGKVTVGLSSGTSGNQGVFLATENERAQWVACILDRVIGFSLKKRTVAFFLRANSNLYDSVKSSVLSFHFFDLLKEIETNIEALALLNPTILVAQPSMLIEIAKSIEKGELKISPNKIISVAEVLYPEDKIYLESVFNQIIHQVYQCTEGLLASTCIKGTLHFHEDYLQIEKKYLNEEKTRFHPVITDFKRSSQPIVRYELNDVIQEKKNCSCGLKTLAIEQIEGRSDDVFVFLNIHGKEIKIFPDFFRRAIIFSDSAILNYVLIKTSDSDLELFIEGTENSYKNAANAISELLYKLNIDQFNIKQISSSKTSQDKKLRRIRNEYYSKTN